MDSSVERILADKSYETFIDQLVEFSDYESLKSIYFGLPRERILEKTAVIMQINENFQRNIIDRDIKIKQLLDKEESEELQGFLIEQISHKMIQEIYSFEQIKFIKSIIILRAICKNERREQVLQYLYSNFEDPILKVRIIENTNDTELLFQEIIHGKNLLAIKGAVSRLHNRDELMQLLPKVDEVTAKLIIDRISEIVLS